MKNESISPGTVGLVGPEDVTEVEPGAWAQDVPRDVDVDVAEMENKAGVGSINESRVVLPLDWIPVLMPSLSPSVPPETWSMDKYLRFTLKKLRCLVSNEEGLMKIQRVHWELYIIGNTLQRAIDQVKPKSTFK